MMFFLVSAIVWDTDGYNVDLPETIGFHNDENYSGEDIEDDILYQVSYKMGWDVNSCFIEQIDEADLPDVPPVDYVFTLR